VLTGVILAGGRNRRMGGSPKALQRIGGHTLLMLQLEEMAKLCSKIMIVTNDPELLRPAISSFQAAEVCWASDLYTNSGPLGGIHAACAAAESSVTHAALDSVDALLGVGKGAAPSGEVDTFLWIVGCDMPFISSQAATFMLEAAVQENAEAVVPYFTDKTHPLHAIYRRVPTAAAAEKLLTNASYRLMGMLDLLKVLPVNEAFFLERSLPLSFVTNVNTPEDFTKLSN
jgi:molybdopterin-guanine dinucleotide biosynthesis protein A